MSTTRSTTSRTIGRTAPVDTQEPMAPLRIPRAASGEQGERQHLLILFFVTYIAALAAGLIAVL